MNKEGYSSRRIAKILGSHHSTIAIELKRCESEYKANVAKKDRESKSCLKGRKTKSSKDIVETIREKLNLRWPPEQISNTLFNGKLSFKTIYNWIYFVVIDFDITKLRRKGKSRQRKETRGRFNIVTSISKRPKEAKARQEFAHWELDTVVSSRGESKGCLVTFIERKPKFYVALPMKDRSKESMLKAMKKLIIPLPKTALKSFTSDRCKEFARYKKLKTRV